MVMKKIKDNTHGWKDILCSWIGRIIIVKITITPKAIYRFNAIPIKLPMAFFKELEQNIFKTCMETQRCQIVKTIFRKNGAGGMTLLDFRLLKATVIKTVW